MRLGKIALVAVGVAVTGAVAYAGHWIWKGIKVGGALRPIRNLIAGNFLHIDQLLFHPEVQSLLRELKVNDTPLFLPDSPGIQGFIAFHQQQAVVKYHHNKALLEWLDFDPQTLTYEDAMNHYRKLDKMALGHTITLNQTVRSYRDHGDMSQVILR